MKTNIEKKQNLNPIHALVELIADSILDKKGEEVVSLDMTNLDDAMGDYFIICEGNSPPQVRAIADNIAFKVEQATGEAPLHYEGTRTCEWVLLDFFNVVVHIFHKDVRHRYSLEELWADAVVTRYLPDGSKEILGNNNSKSFLKGIR